MEKYVIFPSDGAKLVKEDLEAGWSLAGTIDDKVRAQLAQIPVESGDRKGYVVADVDGPIVQPNGATGTVIVKPFTAYRSPNGAETTRDLMTGHFAGSTETVPTPLPTAGNHNWYLLYAVIAETDSDAESRLVEDPVTEVVAATTINTRHKATVTLAWVQGTQTAQATNPYPAGSFPALPAPSAGQAHVALAYVHVFDDATPATVTYNLRRILNSPTQVRFNPQTGTLTSPGGGGLAKVAGGYANTDDAPTNITGSTTWPVVDAARPAYFIEPVRDDLRLVLPIVFSGSAVVGAAWAILGFVPVFPIGKVDWKNRWFEGRLYPSEAVGSLDWAHNESAGTANRVWPSSMPITTASKQPRFGLGNTIAPCEAFETESGLTAGDWYVAMMIRDVLGTGANTDLALLVRRSASGGGYTQGGMYLAAREAVADSIDNRALILKLDVTNQLFPYGF